MICVIICNNSSISDHSDSSCRGGIRTVFIYSFADSSKLLSKVDFIIAAEKLIAEKTHALRSQITFRKSSGWSELKLLSLFTIYLWVFAFHLSLSHSFHEMNVLFEGITDIRK